MTKTASRRPSSTTCPAPLLNELRRQEAKLQQQQAELTVLRAQAAEVAELRQLLAGQAAELRAALRTTLAMRQ